MAAPLSAVAASARSPDGLTAQGAATPSAAEAADGAADAKTLDIFSDSPPGRGGPLSAADDELKVPGGRGDPRWGTALLVRGIISLALVLLLILAAGRAVRYFTQRSLGTRLGGAGHIAPARVLQRLSLSPRHALAWVESGSGQTFLVGFGDGGMSMLGPLPPCGPAAGSQAATAGTLERTSSDSAVATSTAARFSSALANARADMAQATLDSSHAPPAGQS